MSTGLLGEHPLMHGLRAELANYANQTFPVLIEGESGTGKEIAACHHLHRLSRRKSEALLVLNCSSINPMLIETSLFGHARGAFTGEVREQSGYFGDSGQGTLFLDEIGELPLELQGKLLRVLENGEYQRLGETRTRQSNARIIAATNRNLHDEIRQGRFRADLYHRLSVFKIVIPPLRDRGSDSLLLLDHFREQLADKVSLRMPGAHVGWQLHPITIHAQGLHEGLLLDLLKRMTQQEAHLVLVDRCTLTRTHTPPSTVRVDASCGLSWVSLAHASGEER